MGVVRDDKLSDSLRNSATYWWSGPRVNVPPLPSWITSRSLAPMPSNASREGRQSGLDDSPFLVQVPAGGFSRLPAHPAQQRRTKLCDGYALIVREIRFVGKLANVLPECVVGPGRAETPFVRGMMSTVGLSLPPSPELARSAHIARCLQSLQVVPR